MIVSFTDFTMKLARGQLKNTALVDDTTTGEINPEHEDQILELVNQGLVDITTRKKLWQGIQALTFVDGQNVYTLSEVDFPNFVRVLSVHGVLNGYDRIEANERVFVPKTNSHIIQPSPTTIRFSDQFMTDYAPAVDIHYHQRHPDVTIDGDGIDLPPKLHEALVLYVAGLYLSHMGGEEHTAKGDSYYGLYLKMIGDDELTNASATSELLDDDTRFQDRGFV